MDSHPKSPSYETNSCDESSLSLIPLNNVSSNSTLNENVQFNLSYASIGVKPSDQIPITKVTKQILSNLQVKQRTEFLSAFNSETKSLPILSPYETLPKLMNPNIENDTNDDHLYEHVKIKQFYKTYCHGERKVHYHDEIDHFHCCENTSPTIRIWKGNDVNTNTNTNITINNNNSSNSDSLFEGVNECDKTNYQPISHLLHEPSIYSNQEHKFTLYDRLLHTEKAPIKEYRSTNQEFRSTIHWGQRKLLLSEIEFLTLYAPSPIQYQQQSNKTINTIDHVDTTSNTTIDCKESTTINSNTSINTSTSIEKTNEDTITNCYNGKQIYCVYAGAAPGEHITLLSDLFPHVKFILIDPNPFSEKLYDLKYENRIQCIRSYFTNEMAESFQSNLSENSDKIYLFISDIRSADPNKQEQEEHEEWVKKDMDLQMNWITLMKPRYSMIKFRLPYITSNDLNHTHYTLYLDGLIYLPVWGRQATTETRLVIDGNNLKLKWYDNLQYEQELFYFNRISRISFYPHSIRNIENIDYCYDCRSELFILELYLKSIQFKNNFINLNNLINLNNMNELNNFRKLTVKELSLIITNTSKSGRKLNQVIKSKDFKFSEIKHLKHDQQSDRAKVEFRNYILDQEQLNRKKRKNDFNYNNNTYNYSNNNYRNDNNYYDDNNNYYNNNGRYESRNYKKKNYR